MKSSNKKRVNFRDYLNVLIVMVLFFLVSDSFPPFAETIHTVEASNYLDSLHSISFLQIISYNNDFGKNAAGQYDPSRSADTTNDPLGSTELEFNSPASSNANLSRVLIDGVELSSFVADSLFYSITLPLGTEMLPTVEAVPENRRASVDILQVTGFPGNAVITVVSEDKQAVQRYIVHFNVDPKIEGWHIPLRVMTFNIHAGRDMHGLLHLQAVADVIKASEADIVGLQEVDKHWSLRSDFIDQVQWLADYLEMDYVYGANLDRPSFLPWQQRRLYGNAVLSKYPITYAQNHHLESFGDEQRGILETRIEIEGTELAFYNTHLGLSSEQRMAQTEEILALLSQTKGPQLITGDFNTDNKSLELQRFFEAGLEDSFKHHIGEYTFDSAAPFKTIDFILHNKAFNVVDTVFIQTLVSDHLPLYADFLLSSVIDAIHFVEEDDVLELELNQSHVLVPEGRFKNGYLGELSSYVEYHSSSNAVRITPEGVVTAEGTGEAIVTATYESSVATIRIIVPERE